MKTIKERFGSQIVYFNSIVWVMLILLAVFSLGCDLSASSKCSTKFKRGDKVRILINGEEGVVNGFNWHRCSVRLKDLKEYGFDVVELEHINKIKTF